MTEARDPRDRPPTPGQISDEDWEAMAWQQRVAAPAEGTA